jgi:transcriptional regulator with XRE-family HTH domain
MSLFDFLKTELRARDWSMTDLARKAGCSKQIVSQWLAEDESLRIKPSPASCKKIAEALGLDLDYVLDLAGHRNPRDLDPAHDMVDPGLARLLASWPKLPEGRKEAILALASAVIGSGNGNVIATYRRLSAAFAL